VRKVTMAAARSDDDRSIRGQPLQHLTHLHDEHNMTEALGLAT
jgi:hypothetical protein